LDTRKKLIREPFNQLTLEQLDVGIEAAISNAESLIQEAALLLQNGFHARAYTLAHIAREEMAKVTMFYATGLRMLGGIPVDWAKLQKRLRDHGSKLSSDALLTFLTTPGASESLRLETMLAGVKVRNEWKNDSLYIVLKGGNFKTPSEIISPIKASRTIEIARFTLLDAKELLSANGKLANRRPESVKKIFTAIGGIGEVDPVIGVELLKEIAKLLNEKRAVNAMKHKD
jgi:AbiV family abortive infection protein